MTWTDNAVVAQMVRDAICNDDRKSGIGAEDVLERAKKWYERALALRSSGNIYYKECLESFERFLCDQESNFGILDFWEGDVVEYKDGDRSRVGAVRNIYCNATIHGGGGAIVVFPDGSEKHCGWRCLSHSKIPQEILDVARAQIIASFKCPIMNREDDDV